MAGKESVETSSSSRKRRGERVERGDRGKKLWDAERLGRSNKFSGGVKMWFTGLDMSFFCSFVC